MCENLKFLPLYTQVGYKVGGWGAVKIASNRCATIECLCIFISKLISCQPRFRICKSDPEIVAKPIAIIIMLETCVIVSVIDDMDVDRD